MSGTFIAATFFWGISLISMIVYVIRSGMVEGALRYFILFRLWFLSAHLPFSRVGHYLEKLPQFSSSLSPSRVRSER
jgi:hypothetical protein